MDTLKPRQRQVLEMIVDTYVETGVPVGSRTIAERHKEKLSSATIRHEMHDLETLRFITHPYTSAGRVPTDKGYRYYVDELMLARGLDVQTMRYIAREYKHQLGSMETLIERTSRMLATLLAQAGFVTFPLFEALVLKRVDLTSLGNRHVLVVWVAENGFIKDQVVDMREEISEHDRIRLSRFLNEELAGLYLSEIIGHIEAKIARARDSLKKLFEAASFIVSGGFPKHSGSKLYVEGARFVLDQPEFQDLEKSKQLIRALDSKEAIVNAIGQERENTDVTVHIGLEHNCAAIWDCSLVTAQYLVRGRPAGTLGILGPRRMPYAQAVSVVRYVSEHLGDALAQWV